MSDWRRYGGGRGNFQNELNMMEKMATVIQGYYDGMLAEFPDQVFSVCSQYQHPHF